MALGGTSSLDGEARLVERSEVADLAKHLEKASSPTPASESAPSQAPPLQRATSWCDAEQRRLQAPWVGEQRRQLCSPGGFRRGHLHQVAESSGLSPEERPAAWSKDLVASIRCYEDAGGPQHAFDSLHSSPEDTSNPVRGRRQLLGSWGIAVAIFKGNCNCNVLYMPGAWKESGWSFQLIVLPILAFLSTVCVARLLRCRQGNTYNYGELMELAGGKNARLAVNVSIILLQFGVCCLYFINVAALLQSTCFPRQSLAQLIIYEALAISPLAAIRNVSKLGFVNLVAGLLVVIGIAVTLTEVAVRLDKEGPRLEEFHAFRKSGALVGLGTACFVFEGIGLVTSIYDSSRYPEKFMCVYSMMIGFVMLLIIAMAVLGYAAFGDATQTLVLLNLPQGTLQKCLKLAFGVAMLATFPLQLLPAVRLVENLFLSASRPRTWDKYIKSAFRMVVVAFLAAVAVGGATSLSNFVSVIGALCGVPLAYVFPAICHLRLCGDQSTRSNQSYEARKCCWSWSDATDYFFIVFGIAGTVIITVENILRWGQ